jgi:Protein phosphatase 2C
MQFNLLDSLTLPGNPAKPNEDAFGHVGNAAIVMDGATGLCEPLMPGDSDAAWLAQKGTALLMAFLRAPILPRMALHAVLNQIEYAYVMGRSRAPVATYEKPFASMMLVVASDKGFEALSYGDCAALIQRPDGGIEILGEAFEKRAREASRVAQLAKAKGMNPAGDINRPEFLEALRAARNHVNTKGHWLFGPDATAADHVAGRQIDASPGTIVLLASDGFLALASDYKRYDAAGLIAAAQAKGLKVLSEELRAIEAADPDGAVYPRFKTSDDATALLLELA